MINKTIIFFFLGLLVLGVSAYAEETAGKTTLDNLQAAYNGESNAHARYLAFAKKADEEGYGQVASLFRAASQAEKIHLTAHAKVIEKLGAAPKAVIEAPVVTTTKENLEAAVKGESYERDTMYPEFLAKAVAEKNAEAVESFTEAKDAEAVHAKLYADSLKNLDSKAAKKDYSVCSECGNIFEAMPEKVCNICGNDKKNFMTVN